MAGVKQISNGMNYRNCHLMQVRQGNNYGSVYSMYQKNEERVAASGKSLQKSQRCMERSLNGQPLTKTT
jgi:thiosulfate dehydrogenase